MKVLLFIIAIFCSITLAAPTWSGERTLQTDDFVVPKSLSPMELNELGVRYITGDGVVKDFDYAKFLWHTAADQGHAGAQYNLGQMYSTGTGVKRDLAIAANWYEKAANAGDKLAQFNLGLLYETGKGVEQDYVKAFAWYEKSAFQGLAEAQNSYGRLYEMGKGTEQDIEMAKKWYRLSALQGNVLAQSNLGFQIFAGRTAPVAVRPNGLFLALGAGGSYAMYALTVKKLLADKSSLAVMAVVACLGALMLLPLVWFRDFSWLAASRGTTVAIYLGVLTYALPMFLFAYGLTLTPVATAVTITLMEPLTAGLLGVLIVGEHFPLAAWCGLFMMLSGLFVLTVSVRKVTIDKERY